MQHNILNNIIKGLEAENNRLIKELTRYRGNIVLPLFMDPITRSSVDSVFTLITSSEWKDEQEKVKNPKNLDVIVHSGGGDADAAYHIAMMLHNAFDGKITYIVPRFAKSAATLLVSGGNEILMSQTSELGPIDPQIYRSNQPSISAKAVKQTLELIKENIDNLELASLLANKLDPLTLGEYDNTIKIAEEYQKKLLKCRMFKDKGDEKKVDKIIKRLAEEYTHHGRVIDYDEAKDLKLRVKLMNKKEQDIIWQIYIHHSEIMHLLGVMSILRKVRDREGN